jgi:outer membrane protein insertion porin family
VSEVWIIGALFFNNKCDYKNMKKNVLLLILLLVGFVANTFAASAFVVNKIEIQGLQRVSAETVYNYLPIQRGQVLRPEKTAAIIKSLYKTGFFEHITLSRQGNTLVINVVERSTIGKLKISGNSVIPTDKLTTVMKSLDIAEGRVYNQAMLDKIKQGLLNQYYELGRYNARVDVTVTPMSRNRVLVTIDISEGLVSKVEKINIIGNHAFEESVLTKQLELTTPGLFTFFTQTDRYSQDKLESSLEALRNYYLDHGYLKFSITSAQVEITPDRKSVYLTIVIDEGAQYHVKGYSLSGETIVPREELMKLIQVKPGDVFSRKAVMDSEKAMNDALGEKGYISATVSLDPKIQDAQKEVFLDFTVKPGKRTYVRHVYFTDNTKTNDVVLRREIDQLEASVISTKKLENSKHKLKLKPFIKDVDMTVIPVPEHDDLVDVNYKITEQSAAEATFSIGYSQLDHVILGVGFNQKNFLGTGKTLGVNASTSRFQNFFGVTYTDPYFTPDGVSRTTSFAVSQFKPGAANITSGYTTNEYDISDTFRIPLGRQDDGIFNWLSLGYGYQNTLVSLHNPVNISNQVYSFVNQHGHHFQQLNLLAGFARDSRDKAIFPTSGMVHSLDGNLYLPVAAKSLSYYTLTYDGKWYHPIYGQFIAAARGDIAYGGSLNGGAQNYPFYRNFYAGGIESVRGYLGNTLGPRDSTGSSSGGNLLVDGSIGLIFPNPLPDTLRTTVFLDAGNVYDTYNNRIYGGTASGPIRLSCGIEADWLTPLGVMVDVSLARAIHSRPGDRKEPFQLSLGANFG